MTHFELIVVKKWCGNTKLYFCTGNSFPSTFVCFRLTLKFWWQFKTIAIIVRRDWYGSSKRLWFLPITRPQTKSVSNTHLLWLLFESLFYLHHSFTLTLENTEEKIKKGQSRDTGHIGYTRHMTTTNKTKSTTQKSKKMNNTDPSKSESKPMCSRRVSSSCLL